MYSINSLIIHNFNAGVAKIIIDTINSSNSYNFTIVIITITFIVSVIIHLVIFILYYFD